MIGPSFLYTCLPPEGAARDNNISHRLTLASRAWQSCSRVVLMWGTPILRCLHELYRATPGGYDLRRRRGRRLTFTFTKASVHSYFKTCANVCVDSGIAVLQAGMSS